jgi:hypothetical protein
MSVLGKKNYSQKDVNWLRKTLKKHEVSLKINKDSNILREKKLGLQHTQKKKLAICSVDV